MRVTLRADQGEKCLTFLISQTDKSGQKKKAVMVPNFPTLPDVISFIAWSAIVARRVPDVGNIGQRVIGVASKKEAASFNSSAYLQYFQIGT